MGDIDVDTRTAPRKTAKSNISRSSESHRLLEPRIDKPNLLRAERTKICGAMTLQSGDSGWGNQSAPQKLLHLVGCRENNTRPEPPKRPVPAKW